MQNERIREKLLATGEMLLAKASEYDTFWTTGLNIDDNDNADPKKWRGENALGRILMEVRDKIREGAVTKSSMDVSPPQGRGGAGGEQRNQESHGSSSGIEKTEPPPLKRMMPVLGKKGSAE